jgi:hypothetical protein
MAKFRCGVAPIRIETGRYENLNVNDRTCFNCLNCIEDEEHVLLKYPLYTSITEELYTQRRGVFFMGLIIYLIRRNFVYYSLM